MTDEPVDPIVAATAPAAWLLELGLTDAPLTQTFTLARTTPHADLQNARGSARSWRFGPTST